MSAKVSFDEELKVFNFSFMQSTIVRVKSKRDESEIPFSSCMKMHKPSKREFKWTLFLHLKSLI